jgi:tetratricopeptide (TPR) repeat protein
VAGLAFSVLAIAPVLGMRGHESSLINDRYTYMASLGLIFVFVMGVKWLIDKKPKLKVLGWSVMVIIALAFLIKTTKQIKVWENSYTLWNNVIEEYPELSYGYFYRGNIMFRVGNYAMAVKDYNRAISLKPDHAEFYRNRGSAKDNMHNSEEAVKDFTKAIELFPEYASAYMDRGGARAKQKNRDLQGAIADVSKAIELQPEYWEAYYRRGVLLRMIKDHKNAIRDFDICEGKVVANDRVYLYRGLSKKELKMVDEACIDWQKSQAMGNSQAKTLVERYCK